MIMKQLKQKYKYLNSTDFQTDINKPIRAKMYIPLLKDCSEYCEAKIREFINAKNGK